MKITKMRKQIEAELIKTAQAEDIKTKKIHSLMNEYSFFNESQLKFNEIPTEPNEDIQFSKHIKDIKKIDNIPVDIYIKCRVYRHYHQQKKYNIGITLSIQSKCIYDVKRETHNRYYEKYFYVRDIPNLTVYGANCFVFETIVKILELFPLLKFDKFNGKFTTEEVPIPYNDLFKFDNTECEECEECSVCYEHTKSKTPCGHYLCFVCNENMPVKGLNGDMDEEITRDCPICRKNIIWIGEEDEEDEDERNE